MPLRSGFLVATVLFLAGIAAGWFFVQSTEPLLRPALENLIETAEKAAGTEGELRQVNLAGFIFLNNLLVAAILVMVGHVAFALPAVFVLAANGALLGLVARTAGIPLTAIAAGIAPHGVIELPTLLFAAGFALALAANQIKGREIPGIAQRLGFLFRVIDPLLLLAAVLEVYLTP
ncbi:MAG: stage II sporulation protein M, partial [Candidatus Desulforudis sp.]|nr:stage II sporulation protein M [Desulforudis sp.]